MKPGRPLRRLTPLRGGTPLREKPWEDLTEEEQEETRQRARERRIREKAVRLAALSPSARLAYQHRLLLVQARRAEKAERRERDAKAVAKKQWQRLRNAVWERDQGCVRCGCPVVTYGDGEPMECHHRKLRSQGGPDEMFNLVALCGDCHRWAHSKRTESEPLGLIVPSHGDPASVPVTYFDGSRRLLAEEKAA